MLSVGKFFLLLLNLYGFIGVSIVNYAIYFTPHIRYKDISIDTSNVFFLFALVVVLFLPYMFIAVCIDHFSKESGKHIDVLKEPLGEWLQIYTMITIFAYAAYSVINLILISWGNGQVLDSGRF